MKLTMGKRDRMRKKREQGKRLAASQVGKPRVLYTYKDKVDAFEGDLDEFKLRKMVRVSQTRPHLKLRRSKTSVSEHSLPRILKSLPQLKKARRTDILNSMENNVVKDILLLVERWNTGMQLRGIPTTTLELNCKMIVPMEDTKLYKHIQILSECGIVDVSNPRWKSVGKDPADEILSTTHNILYTYCHRGISTRTLQDVLSACNSPVKAHRVWKLKHQLNAELDIRVPILKLK